MSSGEHPAPIESFPETARPDAQITPLRPHLAGVFDSGENPNYPRPLPVDDTFVVVERLVHASDLSSATVHVVKSRFELEDTSQYATILSQPRQRKTDRLLVFTTALGTHIEDRYNQDLLESFTDLGIPVLGIGPEENTSIPQTLTAQHMHEIVSYFEQFGIFDPEEFLIAGDSRGAMVGQLFAAYAERYGRTVIDGCVLDPCLARQIQYTNPKEILQYVPYLGVEGYSFARQIQRIGLKKGLEHVRHLRLSLATTIRTGLPLLSGDAGEFARYMPEDQRLKSILFLGSVVNQYVEWEKIYDQYPNIDVELIKGSHISLLRPDVWRRRQEHLEEARDLSYAA